MSRPLVFSCSSSLKRRCNLSLKIQRKNINKGFPRVMHEDRMEESIHA